MQNYRQLSNTLVTRTCTWKLQVVVQRKQEVQQQAHTDSTSWWDWNPFHMYFAVPSSRRGLFDSLWDDDLYGFGLPSLRQHRQRLEEERRKAERA